MEKKSYAAREAFTLEIKKMVSEKVGTEYQVERLTAGKNNGVIKETLHVSRKSSDYALSFYLEELYRSYCKGISTEALSENIAEIVREEDRTPVQIQEFLSRSWVEENLFLRLVNFEKNLEQLKDAVYVRRLDLAAVFYVLTEQGEGGIKSFRLPRELWERMELGDAEEYFEYILENTERLFPAELKRIEDSLAECIRKEGGTEPEWLKKELQEESRENGRSLFYVLTNRQKLNGAIALFYPGLLSRLEEKFHGGFYLIPSSIHEILLLAESEEAEAGELNQMVREVNESHVIPEEILSDHVYYYHKSCGLCSRLG